MAINFPNSPIVGDIFSIGTTSWQWDGISWNSYGQTSTINSGISGAANTVAVFKEGVLVLANSTLNFKNSSPVIVTTSATTTQTNVSFSVLTSSNTVPGITLRTDNLDDSIFSGDPAAADQSNVVPTVFAVAGVRSIALSAYAAANTGLNRTQVSANSGSVQSNVAINFVNTSTVLVSVSAGSAGNANVAFSTVAGKRSIGIVVDGGGSALTTGTKGYTEVPFSGTIIEWKILADQSGSCVFDVWKTNAAIPTNANSITAAAKPTLTAAQRATSTTLTGWTTSVAANDTFGFEIESASTVTRAVLILVIQEG